MIAKNNLKNKNLLDLIPVRLVDSEKSDDGLLILLFPRFKNPYLLKWFIPKKKSPFIKVNLDKFGTAFWEECNGLTDVHEIGIKLKEKFGDSIEPVYQRLQIFISQMRKGGFLDLKEKIDR